MGSLLVAGGARDPNLGWLAETARRLGVDCRALLIDDAHLARFAWTIGEAATLDGIALDCSAAFIRHDVFLGGTANRTPEAARVASSWYAAVTGFCVASDMFLFNRDISLRTGNKLAMLRLAAESGLSVPRTLVTNSLAEVSAFGEAGPTIAKPVMGGSHAMELGEAVAMAVWEADTAPSPAIIQPKLDYPERRIYRIGSQFFAFDIAAKTLDSRLDRSLGLAAIPLAILGDSVVDGLKRLTDTVRCDFCAIDMKTDPATGSLVFLELNNSPMFMGYDRPTGGAMAEAMVHYLMAGRTER
ncbi:MAG: hypothetical protein ABIQ30_18080 [Devosia sp.]